METRDRTAGDGNKQEREQVTAPDRACTVNKLGQRRHGQRRTHDQNPYRQTNNGTDFQEGREIITRCQQQPHRQHQTDDRHFTNAARAQITQVNPHEDRQRDSKGDGVGSPRAVGQRFHDDHRQYREDNHHDHKTGHQRNDARRWAHLFFHQFAKGTPIATGRNKQHHKVLHRPRQYHPGKQPDHTRQIAHLRRQHRSN